MITVYELFHVVETHKLEPNKQIGDRYEEIFTLHDIGGMHVRYNPMETSASKLMSAKAGENIMIDGNKLIVIKTEYSGKDKSIYTRRCNIRTRRISGDSSKDLCIAKRLDEIDRLRSRITGLESRTRILVLFNVFTLAVILARLLMYLQEVI